MRRVVLKTALSSLIVGLGLAFAPVATFAQDDIKIAVVTHGQSADSYWGVVKKGVDDAAALMGVDVSYQAPQTTDMVAMARMIDAAVAQKVQGLVVSIPDATALEKSVKGAADAGIPVIVIDSGEPEVERLGLKMYIGTTSYFEQGALAAKHLVAAGVTHGVCTNHEPGNLVNESACDGFKEAMKTLGAEGDRTEISLDPTDTGVRIIAYLTAHPQTNGILAVGAPAAANIIAALREKGTLGNYKIGNFDVNADTLTALAAGETLFSFDAQQYLMGYLPVVFLTLHAKYGIMPTKNVYTGPMALSPADVEQIAILSKKGIR